MSQEEIQATIGCMHKVIKTIHERQNLESVNITWRVLKVDGKEIALPEINIIYIFN